MKLEAVLFKVGNEKRNIRCYQITANSDEHCFFWQNKLYSNLLPIMEANLRRANQSVAFYKRDCQGRRYGIASSAFWESMITGGNEVSTILENV